jgi:hypothetical protein
VRVRLIAFCAALTVACASAAAPAQAEKLERYSFELTEFSGESRILTSHEIHPCSPGYDVVTDGRLEGSFSSPFSGIENVRIGKSNARGKLVADAGPVTYQQSGQRDGDHNPCDAEESAAFGESCARQVPTTPGIVGRLIDATKKKVEVEWQPTFSGVERRFTPDFFCIPKFGPIPMPTFTARQVDSCEEHRYPRRLFERDNAFELEVVCATDYVPFANAVGVGTYAGNYRAQLTLEAVAERSGRPGS